MPKIGAVVLAAGLSTRMEGRNKLLTVMPSGLTMLSQAVHHVCASGAAPVFIVTGHQRVQVHQALTGLPVQFVFADHYADGISSSLRTGIQALRQNVDAVLVCLGDMPLVTSAVMQELIRAYDCKTGDEIVVPTFRSRRGNPVLWGRRFFDELQSLEGDRGGRQLMKKHEMFVREVEVQTSTILQDFDTEEAIRTSFL